MRNRSLIKRKISVVFHEATSGFVYDLRDYLLKEGVEELLFISHPLLYLKDNYKKRSRYEIYKKGILIKTGEAFHWKLPEPLLYIKDVIYTILWCISFGGNKNNLFIGIGNLNAFSGNIVKLLNKNIKVIYYVIDFIPKRFENKVIDFIYQRIEKLSAENSYLTWNLSPRMIEGRKKKWKKDFPNQIVVPHGVNFKRIKRVPLKNINLHEILYMGTLLEKQGIQLIISSLPIILKSIPDVQFTIIGRGPYEEKLKKLVKKEKLEKHVSFLGYIKDHSEVENRIAKAAIAVAIYNKRHDDFSYYADPGKIKSYLGAGVPVIMTDVPFVAKEVEEAKCGLIVEYNKNQVIKSIISFFSNKEIIMKYKKNAIKFAKKYDWEIIYKNAFSKIYYANNSNS